MRKIRISCPAFITRLSAHDEIKDELLELITKQPASPTQNEFEKVTRSDYINDIAPFRPYFRLLKPHLTQELKPILEELEIHPEDFQIQNYWFQQYHKTDLYAWHRHSHTSWIIIYYLELPEGTPQTQFKDLYDNTILTADVKEGDILILPGMIKHCSPMNDSDKRKTVIAFNSTIY